MKLLFRDPSLVPDAGRIGNLEAVAMTPIRCVNLEPADFAAKIGTGDPAYYVQYAYEPWALPADRRPETDDDKALMKAVDSYFDDVAKAIRSRGISTSILCMEHPQHIGGRRKNVDWLAFFLNVYGKITSATSNRSLLTQFGVPSLGITEYHMLNAESIKGDAEVIWCNLPGQWGFGRNTTLAECASMLAFALAKGTRYLICWSDPADTPDDRVMRDVASLVNLLQPAGAGSPAKLVQRPGESWTDWLERRSQYAIGVGA